MYCKKCGGVIDANNESEIKNGEHRFCGRTLRYCTYCGKQETENNTHYGMNGYVFCQPNTTKWNVGRDCAKLFIEESKNSSFKKYADLFPKFNSYLQDIFLGLIGEGGDYGYGDDVDEEELINDINTHDGYIVVYHDSDGRMWYKKVPNNLDVLKYIVKSEHRVTLGMGCNQYVECVIFNGEQFEIKIG